MCQILYNLPPSRSLGGITFYTAKGISLGFPYLSHDANCHQVECFPKQKNLMAARTRRGTGGQALPSSSVVSWFISCERKSIT